MPTVAAGASDVAGHPLWHLAVVVAAPAVIIGGLRLHDRLRYGERLAPPAPERPRPAPGRAPLVLAAVASGMAALVHAAVCPEHFREGAFLGVFFLVLSVLQLAWSAAILRRPSSSLLLAGAAGNALVIALWLYTRTITVPLGADGGAVEPVGVPDLAATTLEAVTVVLAVRAARQRSGRTGVGPLPAG